ncbi:hypothetical protein P692DRAFT_20697346, partial [Suillus brevipes Sb2]
IVVAGHTWCSISAARFQVWVRGDTPIDIDVNDGPDVAYGTLFPDLDMNDVNALIKRSLSRMRDSIVLCLQESDPQFDTSPMLQHDIRFPFKLEWDLCRDNFLISAEQTAHKRYIAWY